MRELFRCVPASTGVAYQVWLSHESRKKSGPVPSDYALPRAACQLLCRTLASAIGLVGVSNVILELLEVVESEMDFVSRKINCDELVGLEFFRRVREMLQSCVPLVGGEIHTGGDVKGGL